MTTRLLLAGTIVLFLCSLLVLFSAPTAMLVIIAILVGEWGHYFALLAFVIALVAFRRGKLGALICWSRVAHRAALFFALDSRRAHREDIAGALR